jgi:hypothetical protein
VRLSFERKRTGQNGMRNSTNRAGLVLNIPLISAHEQQTGINHTVLNDHEWYLGLIRLAVGPI